MISSRTTQNAVAGSGVVATVLLAGIGLVRNSFPELLWEESSDIHIVTYLTAVVGPLLARQIAFFRNPEKKQ